MAILAVWGYSIRVPRTKRSKVGFVVSLSYDNEREAKQVRADFILSLRRLIKGGKTGSSFQFIEIPTFLADQIVDEEDALRLRVKTRSHFLLYGRVRVRLLNGKEHHHVELDGVVAHQPIQQHVSDKLAAEFSELLPRKVVISRDNDLLASEFTSQWAEAVAHYVIGIAAAVSGDIDYAEQQYKDTMDRIATLGDAVPFAAKLRKRLPKRMGELNEARATRAYEQWATTHDRGLVDRMGEALKKIDYVQHKPVSVVFLNAIVCFLENRNVNRAFEWLSSVARTAR